MTTGVAILAILLCVLASALYSGSEIGFYSLSRTRVDVEARQGGAIARLVQILMRDESALLVTILIGNNLAIELITHLGNDLATGAGLPERGRELLLTLVLAPFLFFFAEALPKDLFRARPHALIAITAPFIALSRFAFWPLERLLHLFTTGMARLLGLEARAVDRLVGHEAVLHFLAEGRRAGALSERAANLAANALKLRSIPISRAMVPWSDVIHLLTNGSQAELYERVRTSGHTRLPVIDDKGTCVGYVHQLEVLAAGSAAPVLDLLRPMLSLAPETPVDRALLTLRGGAQRAAVVAGESTPQGLVSLKDLLEEISGDLAEW